MRPNEFSQLSWEIESKILQLRGKKRTFKEIANNTGLHLDHVKSIIKKSTQFVSLDLFTKYKIINELESGKTVCEVAQNYRIANRRVKEIHYP